MKISEADILIAPGLGNSPPEHWQRRWGARLPHAGFIEQDNWNEPVLADWVANIHQQIMLATRPVVLIGHSLSVGAIVLTAPRLADTKVRGAFLVSPPDFEGPNIPREALPFAPPSDPLPFPSIVVVSTTDPLVTVDRARSFAADWGSDLQLAGDAGHINAASGHGPWPEGLLMFGELMKRLR
jgi:predicted alpha/beta hydrolase family esterase